MGWLSKIIILWVHVPEVCIRSLIACWYSMIVKREHLGECIAHFEFTIECSVELGIWVKTSILVSSFGCWRFWVIKVLVWQVNLELVILINLYRGHFPQISSVVVECTWLICIHKGHMLERSALNLFSLTNRLRWSVGRFCSRSAVLTVCLVKHGTALLWRCLRTFLSFYHVTPLFW